jgi:hypothetical protein
MTTTIRIVNTTTKVEDIRAAFLASRPTWADIPRDRLDAMAEEARS